MNARLAWRNLWRNPRRSLLTIGSISVGLTAVLFGQSLTSSFQRQMVEKSTGVWLGHLQVQSRGAKNMKLPSPPFEGYERIREDLSKDPRVSAASARLLFTGLVSSAGGSKGVLVCGVEPEHEPRVSTLASYLVQGRYLGESRRDMVLGRKLAEELDLRLGERAVVMAQGRGQMNSELFRVAGFLDVGSEVYDKQGVWIPLEAAQTLRETSGASQVVVRLKDVSRVEEFYSDREGGLSDPRLALLDYTRIGSEVTGIKKFQDALWIVLIGVIFFIVGLGVLNTVSMSLMERVREFGVLRALGMRPSRLLRLIVLEATWLGMLGAALGLGAGALLIRYYGHAGVRLPVKEALNYFMPFDERVFLHPAWGRHAKAAACLFLAGLFAALGPAWKACRRKVVEALRHV